MVRLFPLAARVSRPLLLLSVGGCTFLGSTLAGCAWPSGVLKSRWAMDHPDYAHKYRDDGQDNDDDGWIDEVGEEEWDFSGGLATVYPETGAHFWWTPRIRLTGYGRYWVTTEGRHRDDWLIGGGLAIFAP